MPRLSNRVPKLRKHASGQAFVVLNGKHVYLGKWGTAVAKEAYRREVAEWIARDRQPEIACPESRKKLVGGRKRAVSTSDGNELTVVEVCAAFMRHARKHYVKNGRQTVRLLATRW